jgi:hypothetical protein
MADDSTAYVIPLHQVPVNGKKARAAIERTRANRQRRRPKAKAAQTAAPESSSYGSLIPPEFLPANDATTDSAAAGQLPVTVQSAVTQVTPIPASSAPPKDAITSSRRKLAPVLLAAAALALAGVGITINGWFARSLGANDVAGWLFLAVGAAADVIALVMPCCAAGLWLAGQRATSVVGWAIWLMTFTFAVTAGIGFASTNISDMTLARASRVTPAVTTAQTALADAMAARDRECKGGVGKFCREREAAVAQRRQILDSAMASVGQAADPQTSAAIRLVAWSSRGMLQPEAEDFAMLRLILLALLPQIGGILLVIGRHSAKVL